MKGFITFLKTTTLGGLVFLIPLIIVILIIGEALSIMDLLAAPAAALLPVQSIGGFAVANIISVISIIIICSLAGLLAMTALAGKFRTWIESKILSNVPIYSFIKGITESVSGIKNKGGLKPVLLEFDDNSQFGFEVERTDNNNVIVFLPRSPNPWSGNLLVMRPEKVKVLNTSFANAIKFFSDYGQGAKEMISLD